MGIINSSMRKAIKGLVITCQTAQYVKLIPSPKDFAYKIVNDVVYLSSLVKKLSDDMNELLDSYTDIPINYIMTQLNSINDSLTSIANNTSSYVQNNVDSLYNLTNNEIGRVSALTGETIDTVKLTTEAVASLGMTVAQAGSAALRQEDVASDIHDAIEVVMEWTESGFNKVSSDAMKPFNKAKDTIDKAYLNVTDNVSKVTEDVNTKINDAKRFLEGLLLDLKEKMEKLSREVDFGFKDVTGMESISGKSSSEYTQKIAENIDSVIKNFSISKVIKAFGGVLTISVLVKTGLSELPPIDFELMLKQISNDNRKSVNDLYNELNAISDSSYDEVISFGKSITKIPSDERNYECTKYKEFLSQYNEDLVKQREEIRLLMKSRKNSKISLLDELKE